MQISRSRIIEAEGLKVPFVRFVWVITASYVPPFEPDAHLVNVNILMTNEVLPILKRKMLKEGGHSPERIIFFVGWPYLLSKINQNR
jgi:hypothetical protein